jgi:hypothetical protein
MIKQSKLERQKGSYQQAKSYLKKWVENRPDEATEEESKEFMNYLGSMARRAVGLTQEEAVNSFWLHCAESFIPRNRSIFSDLDENDLWAKLDNECLRWMKNEGRHEPIQEVPLPPNNEGKEILKEMGLEISSDDASRMAATRSLFLDGLEAHSYPGVDWMEREKNAHPFRLLLKILEEGTDDPELAQEMFQRIMLALAGKEVKFPRWKHQKDAWIGAFLRYFGRDDHDTEDNAIRIRNKDLARVFNVSSDKIENLSRKERRHKTPIEIEDHERDKADMKIRFAEARLAQEQKFVRTGFEEMMEDRLYPEHESDRRAKRTIDVEDEKGEIFLKIVLPYRIK